MIAAVKGKPGEDDGEDAPDSSGALPSSDFETLAHDVYDAVKDGDKEAFVASLKAAIHACYDDKDEE